MLPRSAAANRRRPRFRLVLLGLALAVFPSEAPAQEVLAGAAVVSSDENVHAEPGGAVIGRLSPGTAVWVDERQEAWTRVTFEGLVWIQSLQVRDFGAFDLIVSAAEGENLRAEPAGRVLGRLGRGTLLEEVERMAGWARVRRTAWIRSGSLELDDAAGAHETSGAGRGAPGAEAGAGTASRPPAIGDPPGAVSGVPSAGAPDVAPGAEWLRTGPDGAPILAAPGGDTLARSLDGAQLRVVAREGSWTRVQLEGWVFEPGMDPAGASADEGPILRDVAAADLRRDPDRYRGRLVEMTLQFISLERADRIRTDFREGEAFLLTRSSEPGRIFVYLSVPPERVAAMERLAPLDVIRVVARVRTPSGGLTGNPILDLRELGVVR